jgi:uncharacterized protein with GYD domain
VFFITFLAPKCKSEKAIKYLKELKASKNITVRGVYFTFGRYDCVIMFEAPDQKNSYTLHHAGWL